MPDFFAVGKVNAILVPADTTSQKTITNNYGGKLYYKTASDVDTGDTEVAVGSAVTTDANLWIISETESKVSVETKVGVAAQDVSVTDDLTVTDTATVTGKLTAKAEVEIDGDLNHDGSKVGFCGSAPVAPSTVKKAELTANELATELAKMGIVKVEA